MFQNKADGRLRRVCDFLRRIEEGNPLVKVRRVKIKTRFDNKQRLDEGMGDAFAIEPCQ